MLFWMGCQIHSPIHFLVFLLCVLRARTYGVVAVLKEMVIVCARTNCFVTSLIGIVEAKPGDRAAGHPHHRHQALYSSSSLA